MSNLLGAPAALNFTQKILRVHWPLLIVVTALSAIGVMTLYSVAGGSFEPWAERHALRFLVAVGVLLAMALVTPRSWMAVAYPAYVLSVAALCLVPVLGAEALGAKRWIQVGGFSVQPSEFIKVSLVLALARYYQVLPTAKISKPFYVALPLVAIAVPVILTLRQPDLGTAALFAILGLTMMFLAGVSWIYFLGGAGALVAAIPLIWTNLHDYQRRRIEVFLDPEKDPLGAGYHIAQSKIAFGAGGVSGRGFMQGTQSQLDFLPEKHTDFIFTMIGEEWGFVGVVVLLVIFACLLMMLISMSISVQHQFGRLLVSGAGVTVFVYLLINVAMVTGLVPVVGVPLPLVSYGGTSMFTVMTLIGLAMSAHVHARQPMRRDEFSTML